MLRMRQSVRGTVVLALVLLASSTALAQEPVVVLSIRSVDGLLSGVKYVMSAGGSPELGDLVDGMIDQFTQGKGLTGVDRTKPLGAYMSLSAAGTPDFVIFIPVSDNKAFRDLLATFLPNQQEVAGGMFSIQAEGQQFYGKFANGHCFLTLLPAALNKLPDPSRIANTKHDIAIEADLSKIPEDVKDGFVEQFEGLFAAAGEANRPAGDAQARLAESLQKAVPQAIRSFVKETQRLTLGLDIDQRGKLIALEYSMLARPETDLARAMTAMGKSASSFQSLVGPNTAASLYYSLTLPNKSRDVLKVVLDSITESARDGIDKNADLAAEQKKSAHELVDRGIKVLQATADTGKLDLAFVLDVTDDGKAQFVGAAKVAQGEEIAKILEDLPKKLAGQPVAERLKLDVAKHGGARIHAISFETAPDEVKEHLGSGPAHLAVRGDAVYFAIGGDSLAAVKAAIDNTGKPGQSRPPVSLRVKPGKLIPLFGTMDDPNVALARQAFTGDGDHASLELLPIERGMRLRLELGEGILRFIALSIGQQLGG